MPTIRNPKPQTLNHGQPSHGLHLEVANLAGLLSKDHSKGLKGF